MNTKHLLKVVAALFVIAQCAAANASTLSFGCITTNDISGDSCATAESQMTVDVNDAGSGQIQFVFNNTGPDLSAFIADVYFYDGNYIDPSTATIVNGPGVLFADPATPGALPGYSGGDASVTFSADSSAPVAANGIQSGEWLSVTFDLLGGVSYADALATLKDPNTSDFVIGIHAQGLGLDGQYSESLTTVPVPAAAWLFASGLLGLVGVARRRS